MTPERLTQLVPNLLKILSPSTASFPRETPRQYAAGWRLLKSYLRPKLQATAAYLYGQSHRQSRSMPSLSPQRRKSSCYPESVRAQFNL